MRQDRQEVNQFFQSLEAVLTKKRQAYLEALDKAGAEVSRAYDPLILKVKDLQVCVRVWLNRFLLYVRANKMFPLLYYCGLVE